MSNTLTEKIHLHIIYASTHRRDTIKNYNNILLTDGLINLRPPVMSDAEDIYEAVRESMAEIMPWLPFAHKDYSIKETRDFIKNRNIPGWKDDTEYGFMICDAKDGSFIGMCGLNGISTENRRANLGYWIRKSRMGQSAAPAATLLLTKWGFKELSLERIEILIAIKNRRSLRVAEKVGAKREGVLRKRLRLNGEMHDAVMFSIIPGDF